MTRRVFGAMAPQYSDLQLRQALEKLAGRAECNAKCTISGCLDPWVPHWCGLCRVVSFAPLLCVDSKLRGGGTRGTGNDGETAVGAVSCASLAAWPGARIATEQKNTQVNRMNTQTEITLCTCATCIA